MVASGVYKVLRGDLLVCSFLRDLRSY
jgi:hypothetical protein